MVHLMREKNYVHWLTLCTVLEVPVPYIMPTLSSVVSVNYSSNYKHIIVMVFEIWLIKSVTSLILID